MPLPEAMPWSPTTGPLVRDALGRLGIDRLVLAIHQASFPAGRDDVGHGTPYAAPGEAVAALAADLGFTGISLGPAGITSRDNPSPYDGTALSRNPLHIALEPLTGPDWGAILDPDLLAEAVANRPDGDRVSYAYAWDAQHRLLAAAADALRREPSARKGLLDRLAAFRAESPWLAAEERYESAAAAAGHDDWSRWPDPAPADGEAADRFALQQLIAHEQHGAFHRRVAELNMALYGDLPIGLGHRDRLLRRHLFLPGYALGAPPSRTNPDGQPWGFPVLDPAQLDEGGAAREFLFERLDKLFAEYDGLRVDHPHGWVCPWVYRTDGADMMAAVQGGARLHESPAVAELSDHPALARHARVRAEQLDLARARHDDHWVRWLDPGQVERYAAVFDLLIERARARGVGPSDLMVEVLSTCPRPLASVLARHQLGRFRVTQKARVDDPSDVYRGDTAQAQDWIMVGNHDTPPLALVVERWHGTAEAERRAAYLAERLAGDGERAGLAERLARDPAAMANAMVAELFLGPSRNVQLFWVDLFGMRDIYNRPGVVDTVNWSLRLPADFREVYARSVHGGVAPELGSLLAWALRARGLDRGDTGSALAAALGQPDWSRRR
jgi:4-alpha-glucanotransferase